MRLSELSDRQLVEAYVKGQEECFQELLKRYKSRVYGKITMYVQQN
jgi:hypothetical protein